MMEPVKIVLEQGASSLEPAPYPVKGGPGVLRGRVQPSLHGGGMVLKS